MEFNVIDESNSFKIGNILSVFKLPNYSEEFAVFSVSDYEGDTASINVAYLIKGPDGYDYIDEIRDPAVLKDATEAVKELINVIEK